jgi:hypothetical protein
MATQVEITAVSGDALDWFRALLFLQLALGVVLLVILVAIAVAHFWGSR